MRGLDWPVDDEPFELTLEEWVPQDHPLRLLREFVDAALVEMEPTLQRMYSHTGRPSVPPERMLCALVLLHAHSVRSERQLVELIHDNLAYRWFVGLGLRDEVWDHSTFSKNRERLIEHGVDRKFLSAVLNQAGALKLLSREHFSLDGTLLEAHASIKSFRRKDEPPNDGNGAGRGERDFHGEKFSNKTHQSTTDPDARIARKSDGQAAKPSHMGHVLTENKTGLVVQAEVTEANGTAERMAGQDMLARQAGSGRMNAGRRCTVGADKGYDCRSFVLTCRKGRFTPHVAARKRGSAIDGRTTRHRGYAESQRKRKKVEEPFGWLKSVGGMRKLRLVGRRKVAWQFRFAVAVYDLVLMMGLPERPSAQNQETFARPDQKTPFWTVLRDYLLPNRLNWLGISTACYRVQHIQCAANDGLGDGVFAKDGKLVTGLAVQRLLEDVAVRRQCPNLSAPVVPVEKHPGFRRNTVEHDGAVGGH